MSTGWDFFISHASEDKDTFVRELAEELSKSGWRVWYDEFSLSAGDSLREAIDKGISQSLVGVVVLSRNFFGKQWTAAELNGIFTIAVNQNKTLVPIWLDVTADEVTNYSPMLADKVAVKAEEGLPTVIQRLGEVAAKSKLLRINRKVYVYDVDIGGKIAQMVSPISGDWLFKHQYGLPTEAVFGLLVRRISEGGSFLPENFRENMRFVRFMHEIVARLVFEDNNLLEEAKRIGHGFVYLIDRRNPNLEGHIPTEDILGYVRVEGSQPVPGSYERNYNHLLLTENGFFILPSAAYERTLEDKMRRKCAEVEPGTPAVELKNKL